MDRLPSSRHHRQVDGIAIAAFSDPGLLAARETLPVPVVGMAEAAIQAAAESGRRFSIVTIGRHLEPVLRAQVRDYGYAEALRDILFVEGCVLGLIDDRAAFAAATRTLADQAIGGGAQAIVLGGAPFSGIADRLAEQIPAPIYGGIGPAVRHLDSLPLRAEERTEERPAPRIAAHSSKAYPGLEPQLADLLDASLTRLRQSDGSCYGAE